MKKSIFLFFAAILCATSAWAGPSFKGGYVYFHNKGGWSKSSKQLCIGKSSYTETRSMTVVNNTQLWYNSLPTSGWTDATYMAVINNDDNWGSGNWGTSNLKNAAHRTKSVNLGNWEFKSGHYQMLTPASDSNDATLSLGWVGDNISAMNKTITVKAKVSTDKGATYAEKTSPGTLKASSFKFTDYKTCTTTTSLSSGKITCGYTANTTLTAQTDVEGYVFAGWYDDNGTRQTADATLTINPTADATYYAYYTAEPKHNVEITWVCGATKLQASQTVPVGEGTSYAVEAPKFKDYTFSGWTLGTGVTSADKTANPISITTLSAGEYTLTANYKYIEPVIKTIYCKMEHDWWYSDGAAISAYVWGDEEGEWKSAPGTLMTLAPWETKVWKIDIDIARYPKVCFIRVKGDGSANWGAQTKDLVIPTDEKNLFTISNTDATWASSKCDGAWSVYTPAPAPDRYLTGNADGFGMTIDGEGNEQWSPNTIKMTWNDATQKFTHTVSGLEANKYYKFRITDGTWAGKWGYSNLKSAIENVFEAEDNNISFVLAADGDLTITFDGTYIELTTSSSFAAPVYTIVGDAAVTGCHWDVNSVENQMVQDATDKNQFTLVKTVTAVAGEYEYKAIRNHSYDWEVASGTKLEIEKDGTGTITYTLDVSTKKLTAVVSDWVEGSVAQEVILVGIGEDKEFTEAADHKTTSVAVELEANSVYTFEVVVNSVYMKNNGTMWRGNCTNWTFKSEENNAHIVTDLAGTYTFTWTYEGDKLSVTYPNGTNVPAPVFLGGDMNEWSWTKTRLIPSVDGKTASATINLTDVKTYNFKIKVGDTYLGNNGEMNREYHENWIFREKDGENDEKNAKITADIAGDYIFTWTYESSQLTVTYPEVATPPTVIGEGTNTLTDGATADVQVNRSFTKDKLYTISLPFALDAAQVETIFGTGTIIYEFAKVTKEGEVVKLYFQTVSAIAAATPYLIKPKQDVDGFEVEDVTICTTPNNISFTAGATTITMKPILSTEGSVQTNGTTEYWLAADTWLYNDKNTLLSLRALFNISTVSGMPPRCRVALGENAETGIEDIITTNAPTKVIENGQLIIIRDGEKFNTIGQKL